MSQRAAIRVATSACGIELRDVAIPVPAADEVLVEVELCGLCGSDLHVWRGDPSYAWIGIGTVLGHELVGTVSAVGTKSDPSLVGTRVAAMSVIGCGACAVCRAGESQLCREREWLGLSRAGALATQVAVPVRALVTVPADLPARTGVLVEPMSVAVRAVARGRVAAFDRVLVSGPGTIGLLAAVAAVHRGARVTLLGTATDLERRGDLCTALGLPLIADADDAEADVWIEASGADAAFAAALTRTRPGGRIVTVGLFGAPVSIDFDTLIRRELSVLASYAGSRADYGGAVDVLVSNPALGEKFVADRCLSDLTTAMEAIGRDHRPKTAVRIVPV